MKRLSRNRTQALRLIGLAFVVIGVAIVLILLLLNPPSANQKAPVGGTTTTPATPTTPQGNQPGAVASSLRAGSVAVSIPFRNDDPLGSVLVPGDHIDIVVSNGNTVIGVISNVAILRAAPSPSLGALIVEVPREQAPAVVNAVLHESVQYALRPKG